MIFNGIAKLGFIGRTLVPFTFVTTLFFFIPDNDSTTGLLANPYLQDLYFTRLSAIWKNAIIIIALLILLSLLSILSENIQLERKRPYLLPSAFIILFLSANINLFDPAFLIVLSLCVGTYILLFKEHLHFTNILAFNSGLLIGFGIMIFSPFTIYMLVYSFFLLIYNGLDLRKYIIFLLGALTPLYFLFCYQYLILDSISLEFLLRWQYDYKDLTLNSDFSLVPLVLSGLICAYGMMRSPSILGFINVNARKSLNAIYLLCLTLLLVAIFYKFPAFPYLNFALPILAVFVSIPSTELKRGKIVYEIALILCLGLSVFNLCF